jgi:hypothetical protein
MADWKPATLLEALVVQTEFVRETHKIYVLLRTLIQNFYNYNSRKRNQVSTPGSMLWYWFQAENMDEHSKIN